MESKVAAPLSSSPLAVSPAASRLRLRAHPLAVLVLLNTQLLLSALVFTGVGGWLLAPLALLVLGAMCWFGLFLLESLGVRGPAGSASLSEHATLLWLFGWLAGGWGGALMDEQVGYWLRGVRPEAPATRMDEAGRAGLVRLASAELRTELSGQLTNTSTHFKTRRTYYTVSWFATPLVAADWTPGQPVPAWAVSEGARPAWGRERVAVPLHVGNYGASGWRSRGHYLEVVRAAEQAHGLSSTPGAPLFVLVDSLDGELRREGRWFWGVLGVFNVLAMALLRARSGGSASSAR
jgi:hypothetical protein